MGAGQAGVDGPRVVNFVELVGKNVIEVVRGQLQVMAGDTVKEKRGKHKCATRSYAQVRTSPSGYPLSLISLRKQTGEGKDTFMIYTFCSEFIKFRTTTEGVGQQFAKIHGSNFD